MTETEFHFHPGAVITSEGVESPPCPTPATCVVCNGTGNPHWGTVIDGTHYPDSHCPAGDCPVVHPAHEHCTTACYVDVDAYMATLDTEPAPTGASCILTEADCRNQWVFTHDLAGAVLCDDPFCPCPDCHADAPLALAVT